MVLITNRDKVKSINPVENVDTVADETIILEYEV